ncbi:toxin YdaT family protein [Klebsiella variicola]|uniref:toxin YdaT family protein n=1 Tax=Klebsiella variicola TaxID=244366 RepID=UPI000C7CBE3E|nr:toxin YdaT family protein [Klebsiella variicola]PLK33721.1 Rha family transcriptional regulator [Klebsiella variicola]REI48972.1 Rha family transcriptional regulator [Klebsiella variicola]REI53883.1 Rha family transcriptional regulator [Klebsiella variicola]REI57996.1 Rha family transcriptional regulator [Klebsiella variicola]REI63905.1 Rha family transcriptional regulator [Klebsiella variicola]
MKIRHERIREAMNAWALYPGGRKTPVSAIVAAYFELGMTVPELYDESHPDALGRNIQKIYRWIESDSAASVEKIAQLLPAIEQAMPSFLLMQLRSYYSATVREMLERKRRVDDEMEALFGLAIALSGRVAGGGSSGNTLSH